MMQDAISFGRTWGNVLGQAMLESGNAFNNIANAFKNALASMASNALASGLMSGLFTLATGGAGGFGAGFLAGFADVIGIGKRANGGPVTAGVPYVVGERRPELFIPQTSGKIVSNAGSTVTDNSRYEMHFHEIPADQMSKMNPERFAKTFNECVRDGRIKIRRSA